MKAKDELRKMMRAARREHVEGLPQGTLALLFLRPPVPLAVAIPEGSIVGLYHARGAEAPAHRYAQWFFENGRKVALPWFADRDSRMRFRQWRDPFEDSDLVSGPVGIAQPADDAPEAIPDAAFVPLLAFTPQGDRLGQGGGHYDRWLQAHPQVRAVGLAWDSQCVEDLPVETHDRRLAAVVTPTRLYGDLG